MDMTGVKAGDEVRVFDINASRRSQPEGGWPGSVTKVGRVLFTVQHEGQGDPQVFRLDDGSWDNRNYGHQRWVLTAERASDQQRRDEAQATLRRCGLSFNGSSIRELYSTAGLEALALLAAGLLEKA